MTYAKTAIFEDTQQELARFAKALSHPARIAILQLLAQKKVCISGDISNELPLSRTTVSQHLQELKTLGIIKGEVSGLNVCYCLDYEVVDRIKQLFGELFQLVQDDSCC
jgi:ArsR family transcriptional regulator, arsenate/arsenite/antimonite-responsive transcriptional repressor